MDARYATLAAATFVITCLVTQAASAQSGLEPPANPKSVKECESWKESYYLYLNQEEISAQHCSAVNDPVTPIKDWVPTGVCSAIKVSYPPACVQMYSQWHCDVSNFVRMLNACFAAAREAEAATKSEDLSHDLLRKTASGVPDIAGTNAMRMADLLADQGKASAAKTAVQTAVKAYNTTDFLGKVHALYDPKQSLSEKLAALSGLVPDPIFRNNILAKDMLDTAVAGLTATNQTALDNLVRELNAFSAQIARDNEAALRRAVEEAKAEQDRRAAQQRSADEAERRRLAKQRRMAEERANARAERKAAPQTATATPPPPASSPPAAPLRASMPAPNPNNSNDICRPTPNCHTPQCIANCRWDNQFGYYPNE